MSDDLEAARAALGPPYYDDGAGHLIYNEPAAEALARIPDHTVPLVLTDPPWLASKSTMVRPSGGIAPAINQSRTLAYGSIGKFDAPTLRDAFRVCRHDILVLAGFKELPYVYDAIGPVRGCWIWHKPNPALPLNLPCPLDVAFIVWSAHKSKLTGRQKWKSSIFSHSVPSTGCISTNERIRAPDGTAAHPAQGPIALYSDLLKTDTSLVLDCYAGTGTTLEAAKLQGRPAIGIEIEERYCEMAANRLRQDVIDWTPAT